MIPDFTDTFSGPAGLPSGNISDLLFLYEAELTQNKQPTPSGTAVHTKGNCTFAIRAPYTGNCSVNHVLEDTRRIVVTADQIYCTTHTYFDYDAKPDSNVSQLLQCVHITAVQF